MCLSSSGSKTPAFTPPKRDDADIAAKAAQTRAEARARQGRASTKHTGEEDEQEYLADNKRKRNARASGTTLSGAAA